jgi:hypothetical protein
VKGEILELSAASKEQPGRGEFLEVPHVSCANFTLLPLFHVVLHRVWSEHDVHEAGRFRGTSSANRPAPFTMPSRQMDQLASRCPAITPKQDVDAATAKS